MKMHLVLVGVLCVLAASAFAQPGNLDPTFDGDGFLIRRTGVGTSFGYAAARQSDGKIVMAGVANGETEYSVFSVARFNLNGTLDTTFGNLGRVETDFEGGELDQARAVEITADGKIVVAGYSWAPITGQTNIVVARYNTDGSLDTTFSGDGKLVLKPLNAKRSEALAVGVISDGSIYLAGSIDVLGLGFIETLAVKLDSAGNYVNNFGASGIYKVNAGSIPFYPGGLSFARDIHIAESENTIFLAGVADSNYNTPVTRRMSSVIKLDLNGAPYTTFGVLSPPNGITLDPWMEGAFAIDYRPASPSPIVIGGRRFAGSFSSTYSAVTLAPTGWGVSYLSASAVPTGGNNCGAQAVKFQTDGQIVLGGFCRFTSNDFTIARYDPAFVIDNTFSFDGWARFDLQATYSDDEGRALILQPGGEIVLAGETQGSVTGFALARFTADGEVDETFGVAGAVTANTAITGPSEINASIRQSDGKILVAGSINLTQAKMSFYVARHNSDGSLDTTFSGDGVATMTWSQRSAVVYDIALQTDGRIVVVGECGNDICAGRFLPNGEPDPSIVTCCIPPGGWTYSTGLSRLSGARAVEILPGGEILVAGFSWNSNQTLGDESAYIMRFLPNGTSVDPAFQPRHYNLGGRRNIFRDMRVLPDGRIVAVSDSLPSSNTNSDFSVVRMLSDGTPDTTFSTDGIQYVDFGSDDTPMAVEVLADGKILVAGSASVGGTQTAFALTRLLENGSRDTTTFGTSGRVTTDISPSNDVPQVMKLQADGKFIVAGYTSNPERQAALVRYNANGSLDNLLAGGDAWGSNGIVVSNFGVASEIRTLLIQPNGAVLAGGKAGGSILVARYVGALVPTASNVSISGRVMTPDGRAVRNAMVQLTLSSGETLVARSSSFGFYFFDAVPAGQTVVIEVNSKRYQFEPRVLMLNDSLTGVDFTAFGGEESSK